MATMTARVRALGAVAAVVVLLGVSACSDDADDATGVASAGGEADAAGSDDTEALDDDSQALVFAECMRDEGIDVPDPGPGQEGLAEAFQEVFGDHDQATIEQAFVACEDLMPQYAQEEQHGEGAMLDLAECLREEGLEVSDDPFADAHGGEIDQDEFAAAMEVCRNVLTGDGQ